MNKSELIDQIALDAEISKAAAGRALDAAISAVKLALKKGDSVTLVGFGTFNVGKRAASSLSDLMLPDRLISRSEMNRGDFGWSQVVFS